MIDLTETHVMELEQFGCQLKTLNRLEQQGVDTLAKLLAFTPKDLEKLPYIGPEVVQEIIEAVTRHRSSFQWAPLARVGPSPA